MKTNEPGSTFSRREIIGFSSGIVAAPAAFTSAFSDSPASPSRSLLDPTTPSSVG